MPKKLMLAEKNSAARLRFPLWLRFVIFIAMVIISAAAGAVAGYSDLGGGRASDVFKGSTWIHIYDLVEKK